MDILLRLSSRPILNTDILNLVSLYINTLKDILLAKLITPFSYNNYYLI